MRISGIEPSSVILSQKGGNFKTRKVSCAEELQLFHVSATEIQCSRYMYIQYQNSAESVDPLYLNPLL